VFNQFKVQYHQKIIVHGVTSQLLIVIGELNKLQLNIYIYIYIYMFLA
jgi:hypothetical protein